MGLLKVIWPALVPLLGYLLYVAWRAHKRAHGQEMPPLRRAGFLSVVACLLLSIGCFVFLGANQQPHQPRQYEPTHLNDDGTLQPARMP